MCNTKVFVTDDINEEKLAPLRKAGFTTEKRIKLSVEELAEATGDFDSLIVRSGKRLESS